MSSEELHLRLRYASDVERDEILESLAERYGETGDPRDLNAYALACVSAGRLRAAASAFEQILDEIGPRVDAGLVSLSLANTYQDLEWFACSRVLLTYVVEHNPDEDIRDECREQLEQLDDFVRRAGDDAAWRRLQLERAIERIDRGETGLAAAERLSRVVRSGLDSDPQHASTRQAATLLADAAREHPREPELLRGLLHCQLVLGDAQHGDTLRALETLEPASAELAGIATLIAARLPAVPVPATTHDVWGLVERLGEDMRPAALEDLRSFAERYPHDRNSCMALGFGLLNAGLTSELAAYLGHVSTLEDPTHEFQFNLGQLLNGIGDAPGARRRFQLALEYASSDDDAQDAREALQRLEAR